MMITPAAPQSTAMPQGGTIEPTVMNTEVSICAILMRTAGPCATAHGTAGARTARARGRVSDPTDAEPRGVAGEATTAIALFFRSRSQ
jgi:hypothetical protein